jgi:hypothetical protein
MFGDEGRKDQVSNHEHSKYIEQEETHQQIYRARGDASSMQLVSAIASLRGLELPCFFGFSSKHVETYDADEE